MIIPEFQRTRIKKALIAGGIHYGMSAANALRLIEEAISQGEPGDNISEIPLPAILPTKAEDKKVFRIKFRKVPRRYTKHHNTRLYNNKNQLIGHRIALNFGRLGFGIIINTGQKGY